MPIELTAAAKDTSTYVVTIAYFDKAEVSITPNSVSWTLSDADGNVVNSRSAVAIAIPGATNDIVLSGDDLAWSDGSKRVLFIDANYNSDEGSGLPLREEIRFLVTDLTNA